MVNYVTNTVSSIQSWAADTIKQHSNHALTKLFHATVKHGNQMATAGFNYIKAHPFVVGTAAFVIGMIVIVTLMTPKRSHRVEKKTNTTRKQRKPIKKAKQTQSRSNSTSTTTAPKTKSKQPRKSKKTAFPQSEWGRQRLSSAVQKKQILENTTKPKSANYTPKQYAQEFGIPHINDTDGDYWTYKVGNFQYDSQVEGGREVWIGNDLNEKVRVRAYDSSNLYYEDL